MVWGVIAALPALIHARLRGCAGSSWPEQNHTSSKLYANCQSSLMIVFLTELRLFDYKITNVQLFDFLKCCIQM